MTAATNIKQFVPREALVAIASSKSAAIAANAIKPASRTDEQPAFHWTAGWRALALASDMVLLILASPFLAAWLAIRLTKRGLDKLR